MADIFMFRPQVYWVAFLAAPFIGSLPAGPAQAERRFCAYTVHVSAAGVAETPIPGARLRAKGRYIDSGNPSRYITGLGTHRVGAKLEAMIAAEKCLNAAIRSRTKPEFCRSTYRHTGIGSHRNFGQVVSWPIQNLGGSALRTICDRARRFNLAQLQYVRIVAVRVHGDHNCNLGHRRARRPRRTLLYQVPSWSCSSGRPVPRSALPGAITKRVPKGSPSGLRRDSRRSEHLPQPLHGNQGRRAGLAQWPMPTGALRQRRPP